jgi:hypothetical protein
MSRLTVLTGRDTPFEAHLGEDAAEAAETQFEIGIRSSGIS